MEEPATATPAPTPPPRRRVRVLRAFGLLLALVAAGLGIATLAGWFPPLKRTVPTLEDYQAKALQKLRDRVRGVVVYERGRDGKHFGIWKTTLGETAAYRMTRDGRYPRLSPDGRDMAFLRGDAQILLMPVRGNRERTLYTGASRIPAISFHGNGREILFLEKDEVKSVEIATGRVSTVRKIPVPAAVDVSADGSLLIVSTNLKGRHEMHACRLPDGEWQNLGRGCSAAIAPDGSVLTDNNFNHRFMRVLSAADFQETGRIPPPPGMTLDNEAWSNRNDWISYRSEQRNHRFAWLYRLGDTAPLQATFTRDADRPDVFLESVEPR